MIIVAALSALCLACAVEAELLALAGIEVGQAELHATSTADCTCKQVQQAGRCQVSVLPCKCYPVQASSRDRSVQLTSLGTPSSLHPSLAPQLVQIPSTVQCSTNGAPALHPIHDYSSPYLEAKVGQVHANVVAGGHILFGAVQVGEGGVCLHIMLCPGWGIRALVVESWCSAPGTMCELGRAGCSGLSGSWP